MSASPDTDRSLTADQPTTDAGAASTTGNITIPSDTQPTTNPDATDQKDKAAVPTDTPPDLSGLTRDQLEARVASLEKSLTAANTEAEFFRQKWESLKLEDEALGKEALTVDERKLADEHVQAVAELYRSEMKRREALQLLDKLLTTTAELLQTAPNYDPKVRNDYEVASRAAKEYLAGHSGASIPLASTLADGKISDINPELNAVILNVGKNQGVKEGMPFDIYQDSEQVGTVKVVLARDQISAALVQSLKPKAVLKVGDRAVVQGSQTLGGGQ